MRTSCFSFVVRASLLPPPPGGNFPQRITDTSPLRNTRGRVRFRSDLSLKWAASHYNKGESSVLMYATCITLKGSDGHRYCFGRTGVTQRQVGHIEFAAIPSARHYHAIGRPTLADEVDTIADELLVVPRPETRHLMSGKGSERRSDEEATSKKACPLSCSSILRQEGPPGQLRRDRRPGAGNRRWLMPQLGLGTPAATPLRILNTPPLRYHAAEFPFRAPSRQRIGPSLSLIQNPTHAPATLRQIAQMSNATRTGQETCAGLCNARIICSSTSQVTTPPNKIRNRAAFVAMCGVMPPF